MSPYYVHSASLSDLRMEVTARTDETPLAVGVQRLPLCLTSVRLENIGLRLAPLLRIALLHYTFDVLKRAPFLLGK